MHLSLSLQGKVKVLLIPFPVLIVEVLAVVPHALVLLVELAEALVNPLLLIALCGERGEHKAVSPHLRRLNVGLLPLEEVLLALLFSLLSRRGLLRYASLDRVHVIHARGVPEGLVRDQFLNFNHLFLRRSVQGLEAVPLLLLAHAKLLQGVLEVIDSRPRLDPGVLVREELVALPLATEGALNCHFLLLQLPPVGHARRVGLDDGVFQFLALLLPQVHLAQEVLPEGLAPEVELPLRLELGLRDLALLPRSLRAEFVQMDGLANGAGIGHPSSNVVLEDLVHLVRVAHPVGARLGLEQREGGLGLDSEALGVRAVPRRELLSKGVHRDLDVVHEFRSNALLPAHDCARRARVQLYLELREGELKPREVVYHGIRRVAVLEVLEVVLKVELAEKLAKGVTGGEVLLDRAHDLHPDLLLQPLRK